MGIVILLTSILAAIGDNNGLIDNLVQGEWWKTITGVFTSTIGELFFAILFLLGPALLYIKTQSIVPPAMAMLVGGAVLAALFTSPIRFFFALCAIFGVAIVLFQVTKK